MERLDMKTSTRPTASKPLAMPKTMPCRTTSTSAPAALGCGHRIRAVDRRDICAEVGRNDARMLYDALRVAARDDAARLQCVQPVGHAEQQRHVVLDDEQSCVRLVADH